jgi:glycosyltransferase involved in cell wall biosynthesis
MNEIALARGADAVPPGALTTLRSPLRVLYYFAGTHTDSGSPKALLGMIDVLDRSRVTPLFLTSGDGPLIEALEERGVEIVRAQQPEVVSPKHPFVALRNIRRFARLLSEHRIDLLHVNEFGWNMDLVLAGPLARVPVVLHMHLPDTIEKRNLHRFVADRVLLVSEDQKSTVANFDLIAPKTRILYNAVDLDAFARGRSLRSELGLAADDIVVGSLAQLRHGKGIDILLAVARELLPTYPQLVFLVAGRLGHGEEEFGHRMKAEAESPEFNGRFRFLGSRDDVPDLLATFDVFILPTRAETFGIAVVEAMAAGIPVIASRVGAIPEIIPSPELGCVVDPIDGTAFARAVESIITLPDRGRAIGERGRASLFGRFDKRSLGARLLEIYDEIGRR